MNSTVKIFEPVGILDGRKGNLIRQEISDIMNGGTEIVLIDLQNVTFLDSSGLGALILSMKIVHNGEGKFFICSINDQVKMLFELTKMERFFETFATRDEFNRQFLATQ